MELSPIIAFIISAIISWFIFKIISVKGKLLNPVDYGREWSAWIVGITTISILPKFISGSDIEFLLVWLMGLFLFGGITFICGWSYGKIIRNRKQFSESPDHANSDNKTDTNYYAKDFSDVSASRKNENSNNGIYSDEDAAVTDAIDEEDFYKISWDEIENSQTKKSLWAKSFAKCEGDKDKTRAMYINLRVAQLKQEHIIQKEHRK